MASSVASDQSVRPGVIAQGANTRERIVSAAAVALLHVLIGVLLVHGLGVTLVRSEPEEMKLFDVREMPPPTAEPRLPRPSREERARPEKREGAAAPAAPRAAPVPIVVPTPVVPLPVPPPLTVAPVPGPGVHASPGAATMPGIGSGSGGQGAGTGSGLRGSGPGGGGTGIAVHASRIKGEIRGSDYPRAPFAAHAEGTSFVRLVVGVDGRVRECTIDQSSGNHELDATTCALILKRFRYQPARDAQGRPVEETVFRAQVWETRERW